MHAPLATGPFLAATVLLGCAGLVKVARPDDTAGALRAARLPSRPGLVRLGAGTEVAVAALALAGGGAAGEVGAVLVALAYAGFTVFVGLALVRHWPLASCGCWARPDTRPDAIHLVVDAAATTAAVAWAVADPSSIAVAWEGPALTAAGLLVATGAVALLGYLVFTRPTFTTPGGELGPPG